MDVRRSEPSQLPPRYLEPRHLELLREIAARGTLAAVAKATHRTPSALSQQLHTAERELAVKLVEPDSRGVRLTPAGQPLAEGADEVISSLARVQARLDAGQIGDDSWVSTLLAEGYRFAGGWAVAGSTSVQQAEGLAEVENADVLLVMTGTNDLAQGVGFEETAASLEAIVAKAPAERVVLLAIPPRDQETTPSSAEFNAQLQQLAEEQGWEFFDGLEFLRSPDGGFVAGTTTDGVHLTPDAQERFGETVIDYLADDGAASSND